MIIANTIVILMIYVSFVLFVASALSKKHKEKLAKIFGWVFTASVIAIALWGFIRNVL